jgi:hypothetical protein
MLVKMVSANSAGGFSATLIRNIEQLTLFTGLEKMTLILWGNLIRPGNCSEHIEPGALPATANNSSLAARYTINYYG